MIKVVQMQLIKKLGYEVYIDGVRCGVTYNTRAEAEIIEKQYKVKNYIAAIDYLEEPHITPWGDEVDAYIASTKKLLDKLNARHPILSLEAKKALNSLLIIKRNQ